MPVRNGAIFPMPREDCWLPTSTSKAAFPSPRAFSFSRATTVETTIMAPSSAGFSPDPSPASTRRHWSLR